MDNPYQSPETGQPVPPLTGMSSDAVGWNGKVVGRIRVVAVLMIVQGALLLAMGILCSVLSACGGVIAQTGMQRGRAPGMPEPEVFMWYIIIVYGVIAAMHLIPGVLLVWAGFRNYQIRGRVFGLVALGVGLISVFFVFCAPTAIGLAVAGMIVYLNEEAAEAFAIGEQAAPFGGRRA